MRINCTSVEESRHVKEIEEKVKKIFPNYKVVVIPNKYATKEGKEQVLKYTREYHEKHRDKERTYKRIKDYVERYSLTKEIALQLLEKVKKNSLNDIKTKVSKNSVSKIRKLNRIILEIKTSGALSEELKNVKNKPTNIINLLCKKKLEKIKNVFEHVGRKDYKKYNYVATLENGKDYYKNNSNSNYLVIDKNDVTKEFESKPFFLINEIKNEKDEFLYIDKEEMKKVLGELITKELNSDNTKAEHNYYSFSLDKFIDYAKIFYITKNITAILACDFYKDYESRKIENLQRTKNIKKKEKYMKEDMEVER